jgi:hypothetical protein
VSKQSTEGELCLAYNRQAKGRRAKYMKRLHDDIFGLLSCCVSCVCGKKLSERPKANGIYVVIQPLRIKSVKVA